MKVDLIVFLFFFVLGLSFATPTKKSYKNILTPTKQFYKKSLAPTSTFAGISDLDLSQESRQLGLAVSTPLFSFEVGRPYRRPYDPYWPYRPYR